MICSHPYSGFLILKIEKIFRAFKLLTRPCLLKCVRLSVGHIRQKWSFLSCKIFWLKWISSFLNEIVPAEHMIMKTYILMLSLIWNACPALISTNLHSCPNRLKAFAISFEIIHYLITTSYCWSSLANK